MILDIQFSIVIPPVQSRVNLVGLVDFLTGINYDSDIQNSFQIETTFRYRTDTSNSFISSWIPTVNFVRNLIDAPLLDNNVKSIQRQNDASYQTKQKNKLAFGQAITETQDTRNNLINQSVQEVIVLGTSQPQWVRDSIMKIAKGDMKLCVSGVGGTYFISDTDSKYLSVFKPNDEEPGSPNNPKKNPPSFTPPLPWGNGAQREVAAYKLDQQYGHTGFVGVPETHLIEVTTHEGVVKVGSLQQFIENDGDCSDIGANKFSVDDVHRLGIFDIRILNMDRNDENLLVKKTSEKEWKLVPIDHTYSFPNKIDSYFNWQYWSQAKKPFSSESLNYISSIDVLSDAQMLLNTGIDEKSVQNVTGSTLLLQKAAKRGYNLFQMAAMVTGNNNDLVELLSKAQTIDSSANSLEEKLSNFKSTMEMLIDEHLETKL